jgi:hypothetical protein
MKVLTLYEIKNWLVLNREEFQKLDAEKYPPFGNFFYKDYRTLRDFISFYSLKDVCETALNELYQIVDAKFVNIGSWTRQYEVLGSQKMLMFEVNYFDWIQNISDGLLKIDEIYYTQREPFEKMLIFIKLFNKIFWNFELHKYNDSDEVPLFIQQSIIETMSAIILNE